MTELFRERREEAIAVLVDAPEKFEELHLRVLTEAAKKGEDTECDISTRTEPRFRLVPLNESGVWGWGDGSVTWMIHYVDFRAGRLDRFHSVYR
ncbi:hypothetical protein ACFUN7_28235 [Streptomyces sp. NPDC057236]|uniref:hypothetical protein n=1 Tax=Streptomyces sp. NPDC057236 TaxID=3346059 RepID=UPI0036333153